MGDAAAGDGLWLRRDLLATAARLIATALHSAPAIVEPVFWSTADHRTIVSDWCAGFVDAIKLRSREWNPLLTDKRNASLLRTILLLGAEPEDCKTLGVRSKRPSQQIQQAVLDEAPETIPDDVIAIRAFLRRRQEPSSPILVSPISRSQARVGVVQQRTGSTSRLHSARSTHVIRAELAPKVYREVEVVSNASLAELAEAIVTAFGFDLIMRSAFLLAE